MFALEATCSQAFCDGAVGCTYPPVPQAIAFGVAFASTFAFAFTFAFDGFRAQDLGDASASAGHTFAP